MDAMKTMTYEVDGPVARITLNRPKRGNGITLDLPRELAACVERTDSEEYPCRRKIRGVPFSEAC